MASPARDSYLATEVLTVPPQRLHLMLVEAAMRCVERARQCWRANQPEQATEAVVRAEEILGALLAGLNREIGGDLVRKTAAIYVFVFRSLMEANAGKDEGKLDDALRVLAIERETWRRVCEQIGAEDPNAKASLDGVSLHRAEAAGPPAAGPLPLDAPSAEHYSGRFSLDA
jgi:flagellar protein FliS